jgi:tRNA A-37 threonylcarbamoyl transferase component Bud32
MAFTKRFTNTPAAAVVNEVTLHRIGAEYGLSPCILDTDNETFITMEDLQTMNIADFYGESIETMPETIRRDIWNILWTLYSCANIEYVDVTPYNFIEKDGRVWVIDYGHARKIRRGAIDPWLLGVLSDPRMTISEWNPAFA